MFFSSWLVDSSSCVAAVCSDMFSFNYLKTLRWQYDCERGSRRGLKTHIIGLSCQKYNMAASGSCWRHLHRQETVVLKCPLPVVFWFYFLCPTSCPLAVCSGGGHRFTQPRNSSMFDWQSPRSDLLCRLDLQGIMGKICHEVLQGVLSFKHVSAAAAATASSP